MLSTGDYLSCSLFPSLPLLFNEDAVQAQLPDPSALPPPPPPPQHPPVNPSWIRIFALTIRCLYVTHLLRDIKLRV